MFFLREIEKFLTEVPLKKNSIEDSCNPFVACILYFSLYDQPPGTLLIYLLHLSSQTLPVGCYHRLKVVRLVGLMLVIYIHEKHKHQVTNVASEMFGTGVLGIVGNKGGVAVR